MASRGQAKLLTRAKLWQEISCAPLPGRILRENSAPWTVISSASPARAKAAFLPTDDYNPKLISSPDTSDLASFGRLVANSEIDHYSPFAFVHPLNRIVYNMVIRTAL
jgi:hypothetical protein